MFKFSFAFLLLMISSVAFSQEKVHFETLPVPEGIQASSDPSIPKISWYRWTTRNFSIHTIDQKQGQYLFQNIEQIKAWCLERWGLENIEFSAEVRIWCAPDAEMMKKLFNIDRSYGQVKEENGKIKISYLWIVLNDKPIEIIPPALTIVCLKEIEQKHNVKFNWWVYRGLPKLNATIPQIKRNLIVVEPYLKKDSGIFFSKTLLSLTEEQWKAQKPELKKLFDSESALLCLLVRKEFGQKNFQKFMKNPNVISVLGFKDVDSFDATFVRYMSQLTDDIKENRTPDTYLQVVAVGKN